MGPLNNNDDEELERRFREHGRQHDYEREVYVTRKEYEERHNSLQIMLAQLMAAQSADKWWLRVLVPIVVAAAVSLIIEATRGKL